MAQRKNRPSTIASAFNARPKTWVYCEECKTLRWDKELDDCVRICRKCRHKLSREIIRNSTYNQNRKHKGPFLRNGRWYINTRDENGYNHVKGYHTVIWEEFHQRKVPDRYVIHHADFNPLNNDISNLQLVTRGHHLRLHNFRRFGKVHIEVSAPTLEHPHT